MPKDDGPGAAAPVGGGNGNNEALLAPNVVVAPAIMNCTNYYNEFYFVYLVSLAFRKERNTT